MQIKTTVETDDIKAIDTIIEGFLEQKRQKAAAISPYYEDLWNDIARLFHAGGKRLRSRVTLMSYKMFGGKEGRSIVPAAAAMELLHLAMLIHDDIIDRDYVRYGVDNIAGRYIKTYGTLAGNDGDGLHYAQSTALLAGDLLLSESYKLMAESNVEADNILAIQSLLSESIFEVIGGELLDTESVFRQFGDVSAETIALYKTASYTMVLPLLVGARLAGITIAEQAYVRELASNIGIAFQLRDDVLGVFGDTEQTGKSTIGDLREGKHTFMIEQFYQLADPQSKLAFDAHFGTKQLSENDTEILRTLLVSSGALEKTEQAIQNYEIAARSALSNLQLGEKSIEEFEAFMNSLVKRVK